MCRLRGKSMLAGLSTPVTETPLRFFWQFEQAYGSRELSFRGVQGRRLSAKGFPVICRLPGTKQDGVR